MLFRSHWRVKMKELLIDAVMEVVHWLVDRKNYKKNTILGIRMTLLFILAVIFFSLILLIVLLVLYLWK